MPLFQIYFNIISPSYLDLQSGIFTSDIHAIIVCGYFVFAMFATYFVHLSLNNSIILLMAGESYKYNAINYGIIFVTSFSNSRYMFFIYGRDCFKTIKN
jgi:hypothetical protein